MKLSEFLQAPMSSYTTYTSHIPYDVTHRDGECDEISCYRFLVIRLLECGVSVACGYFFYVTRTKPSSPVRLIMPTKSSVEDLRNTPYWWTSICDVASISDYSKSGEGMETSIFCWKMTGMLETRKPMMIGGTCGVTACLWLFFTLGIGGTTSTTGGRVWKIWVLELLAHRFFCYLRMWVHLWRGSTSTAFPLPLSLVKRTGRGAISATEGGTGFALNLHRSSICPIFLHL